MIHCRLLTGSITRVHSNSYLVGAQFQFSWNDRQGKKYKTKTETTKEKVCLPISLYLCLCLCAFALLWLQCVALLHLLPYPAATQIKAMAEEIQQQYFSSSQEGMRTIASKLKAVLDTIDSICKAHTNNTVRG